MSIKGIGGPRTTPQVVSTRTEAPTATGGSQQARQTGFSAASTFEASASGGSREVMPEFAHPKSPQEMMEKLQRLHGLGQVPHPEYAEGTGIKRAPYEADIAQQGAKMLQELLEENPDMSPGELETKLAELNSKVEDMSYEAELNFHKTQPNNGGDPRIAGYLEQLKKQMIDDEGIKPGDPDYAQRMQEMRMFAHSLSRSAKRNMDKIIGEMLEQTKKKIFTP